MHVPFSANTRRPSSRTMLKRELITNLWAYLYLGPMLLLVFTFTVYPIFASAFYSFYKWDGIGQLSQYVGWFNFQSVARDTFFWTSVVHTIIFTVSVVSIQLTLALILALILNNPRLKFSTFYRAVYFVPVVTSQAVIGIVIQLLLTTSGSQFSDFLTNLHITSTSIDWLGNPFWAFVILIIVGIWNYLGSNMINFMAALQSIPVELYEAAQLDGANARQRFLTITVPLLKTVGGVIAILAFLGALGTFDLIQVVTNGGPFYATEMVSTYIYHKAFGGFGAPGISGSPNIGLASAASFIFGVMILGLSAGQVVIARNAARIRKEING
ncbi:lactose ABC transporter permease [Dictyobacter alpinus]|uniref:Lactose ABC transporter permease n=1 Tax=Dictyobacter alpinus TaxID=2014873 RepID=A0A402BDK3_9CHLR|nr:sugar ABC transporter permease [Dictyobacter alpinus]GCE29347.1 lactose ABC transporter permease [Dictyobacter alpinus]